MHVALSIRKIRSLLLKAIVILTALSVSGQVYRFTVGRERFLVRLFDLDLEWNIPSLYSAVTLCFASFLLFVLAFSARVKKRPFQLHWSILSAGFLVMGLDELVQIHEKFSTPLRGLLEVDGVLHFAWLIPFSFMVLLILLGYVRFLLHLPYQMRIRVMGAAAVYLGGAMGIEALSGIVFTTFGRETLLYSVVVHLEEVLEMTGIYLFISTLLDYLCENVPYFEVRIVGGSLVKNPVRSRAPKLLWLKGWGGAQEKYPARRRAV